MILAKVYTDDGAETADFDATRWFEQASDDEIYDLARTGWGGDYEADAVAEFFDGEPGFDDVTAVFSRVSRHRVGFECRIRDVEAAKQWLEDNRPELHARLEEADT